MTHKYHCKFRPRLPLLYPALSYPHSLILQNVYAIFLYSILP